MTKKKETTENQAAVETAPNKKVPVHTAKVRGVSASVFLNQGKDGKDFPSAIVNRRYQGKDGNWKSSNSFSAKQLESLEELARIVRGWMTATYPEAVK